MMLFLQMALAIGVLTSSVGGSKNMSRKLSEGHLTSRHTLHSTSVIHQCFVDRKPEPRWVKHLKHLKREEEVWWLRISSEFDAMRSLTSQHLWVCRVGDDDMMIDGGMAEVETQKSRCVYTLWFMIHSCYDSCYSCCWLLQVPIPLACWIFLLRYKMLNRFFWEFELRKQKSIGQIFGETPSQSQFECLLPCTVRDLKSS